MPYILSLHRHQFCAKRPHGYLLHQCSPHLSAKQLNVCFAWVALGGNRGSGLTQTQTKGSIQCKHCIKSWLSWHAHFILTYRAGLECCASSHGHHLGWFSSHFLPQRYVENVKNSLDAEALHHYTCIFFYFECIVLSSNYVIFPACKRPCFKMSCQ